MKLQALLKELEDSIQKSYQEGTSVEEAERLAAKFLYAQMAVSTELKEVTLDARMRKSGVKGIRASLYLSEVQKPDKKPTEAHLTALLDSNEVVISEQLALDTADVSAEELHRIYDIFNNGHVYFRTIAKGRYDG